jgi:hypothetical protein
MGEKRNVYTLLAERPEMKRKLGRRRSRLVDNIKMDFGERMGWYGLDWSG